MIYPLSALRAVVLHTQRLDTANEESYLATPENIVDLVRALGYVQIDTLNVVNRAHYANLWSRFGSYNIEDFHSLIYSGGNRQLYEGWGHAASIIPLEYYRYHRWRIFSDFQKWINRDANREMAALTLEKIRSEGAMKVGDFEYEGPKRGPWYDWKPTKMALETLFAYGDLMVADRVNFQRVYDLKERVLPEWVDTTPVEREAARLFCLEQAAKALGVFELRSLTWYAYMTNARDSVKSLLDDGAIVKIEGESLGGEREWLVHRDNLGLLQRAAEGEIKPERTTFLAPFDSFFWAGDRDERLWGFNQVLECYKKPEDRIYGYFCFPILYKDRLVGRFDPKLNRKTGVLQLNALYLEPGIEPEEEMISRIAGAMRDFLEWHGAKELQIAKSDPPEFAQKLLQAL